MEGDGAAIVEADGEAVGGGVLDDAQGAVLDAGGMGAAVEVRDLVALVVVGQEDDAIAGGVVPAVNRDGGMGELAGGTAGVAHGVVEAAGVGVRIPTKPATHSDRSRPPCRSVATSRAHG